MTDSPNPLPVDYMYPEKAYFGNREISREQLYVLDALIWRLNGRPYHFEIEWEIT